MTRKEFETEYFISLQNHALKSALDEQMNSKKRYLETLSRGLILCIDAIKHKQEWTLFPIKCIQMSLMRYSILAGKPIVRIDAYGERGVLNEALVTKEVLIEWPIVGISGLKEALIGEAQNNDAIPEAMIDVLLGRYVDMIVYSFRETLRYERQLIEEIQQIQEINKLPDFYVSIGEYMGKQEYVYVERSEVDIFYNIKQESLVFRTFCNAVYKDKKFEKLVLDGTRFKGCFFEQTKWNECSLIDCTFENCVFKKSVFEENDMRGCRFYNCKFLRIQNKKNLCNSRSGKSAIVCRDYQYDKCEIKRMFFEECDLSYSIIKNTKISEIEVDVKSVLNSSDFEGYVKGENNAFI